MVRRTYFQNRVENYQHLVSPILFAWRKFVTFEIYCFIKHGKHMHSQNTSETITATTMIIKFREDLPCRLETNYEHSEDDIRVINKYKERFAGHIPEPLNEVLYLNCGSFTNSDAKLQRSCIRLLKDLGASRCNRAPLLLFFLCRPRLMKRIVRYYFKTQMK